jgi:hypothetical protein
VSALQYRQLSKAMGFNSRFTQGEIGEPNLLALACEL